MTQQETDVAESQLCQTIPQMKQMLPMRKRHQGMSYTKRSSKSLTSILLVIVLINLKPGILLSLHTTPTSSECLQSDTPIPFEGQRARVLSFPVQWTLSNQMRPGKQTSYQHTYNIYMCNWTGYNQQPNKGLAKDQGNKSTHF